MNTKYVILFEMKIVRIIKRNQSDIWDGLGGALCLVLRLSGRQGDILPIPTFPYLPYCCELLDESKYLMGHLDFAKNAIHYSNMNHMDDGVFSKKVFV